MNNYALAIPLLIQVRDFYAKKLTGVELDAEDNVMNSIIINLRSNLFDRSPFQ